MNSSPPLALVVDDEPDLCDLVQLTLKRMGVEAQTANDVAGARRLINTTSFDLCLSDLRLPDGSGIELVEFIQEIAPHIPVAVITAHGDMQTAVEALKAGAFDFVSKPVDLSVLRRLVDNALRLREKDSVARDGSYELIGNSAVMEALRRTISKVARSQAPVCLVGPSGSGKELAARTIHRSGPRGGGPFVPINCGALPGDLLESELFGHRKGAFTGATADKEGLFQAASGGTLFLDEVTELPLNLQVKLLRALQEKSIRPLGSNEEIATDVRIISATNRNLGELLAKGQFREDLYYRINVIEVPVPSLAERKEDIPQLVETLLAKIAKEQGIRTPELTEAASAILATHQFPGNVRELENILARAATLCDGSRITEDDLGIRSNQAVTNDLAGKESRPQLEEELQALEANRLQEALAENRYNKTATAKALGMTLRQLRYRLQKLGIE